MPNDTTPAPTGADAALAQLVAAVEAETDPSWECNSYHPSLWSALDVARAALASAAQPETERERLHAEQSTAVMPLIGPLLDAWESMDNDTRGLVLEQSPELAKYLKAINRAMLAAAPKAAPAAVAGPDRQTLIDVIAQGLSETWHCLRVWSAWSFGTMSQDDFVPVDESDTPAELADAVLALLSTAPTTQAAPAVVAEPSVWGFRFPTGGRWHYTEHGPNDCSRKELIWRPFYEAPQPAAQQGDAEQREVDARHAAIYRWMLGHPGAAWRILDDWCTDEEAGTDELHDVLAARAAKEGA